MIFIKTKTIKLITTIKLMRKRKRTMFHKITRTMDIRWSASQLICGFHIFILLLFNGMPAYALVAQNKLSQSFAQDDAFNPIVPIPFNANFMQSHLFTNSGQYQVFNPIENMLSSTIARSQPERNVSAKASVSNHPESENSLNYRTPQNEISADEKSTLVQDLQDLKILLLRYIGCFLSEDTSDLSSSEECEGNSYSESEHENLLQHIKESYSLDVNTSRSMQSGRLIFFAGLKKILWPLFVGVQIFKSLLFAMFLPTIIGSFGKILGKGIPSISSFNRPSETVDDLQFQDNMFNMEDNGDNNNFMFNIQDSYNPPDLMTNTKYSTAQLYNAATMNNQGLSRFGANDNTNTLQAMDFHKANVNGFIHDDMADATMNSFEKFQKIPVSALLLSNYDPFYSPLLSRLDSVFMQLKLNTENEECREKLICLMYADPVKYAPYSNLVSAQLSRELNELRKPTSDNPNILRFFKYMRAAKDGQSGIDCEKRYESCTEFKDFTDPAMISAFYDIDKLVQARKIA